MDTNPGWTSIEAVEQTSLWGDERGASLVRRNIQRMVAGNLSRRRTVTAYDGQWRQDRLIDLNTKQHTTKYNPNQFSWLFAFLWNLL